MLARTFGPKFSSWPAFAQPKLNGVRCLAQSGVLQARGHGKDEGHLWLYTNLQHIFDELEKLKTLVGGRILDGELYVHGWRLQRINGSIAINRTSPREDTPSVQYHVFDCIGPKGFNEPFWDRYHVIYNALRELDNPIVRAVETVYVDSRELFLQFFNHWTGLGFEGAMIRLNGPYELGLTERNTEFRSPNLWKHKQWQDDEYECIGVTPGEGKADIGIGALKLKVNLDPITNSKNWTWFKVGTGLTDEDRIEFSVNPPIGKLVKVRYLELTADGIPFNPSFLCVMS